MIGGRGSSQGKLNIPGQVTLASGTGITVHEDGDVRDVLYKITTAFGAWSAAALTKDITLATLPAKAVLCGIFADTTQAYAGVAGTIALTVGISAGGAELVVSHDVKSGVVTKGLADADLGTSINRANAVQAGLTKFSGTQTISARITSGSGNLSGLNAGSTTFYILVRIMP